MPENKRSFQTDRTRFLRECDLDAGEDRTVSQIEEYGWSVMQVKKPDEDRALFSYSIGVFDTCGKPELIVAGLKTGTAQALLNEAARQMREGVDLTQGRHRDMVGEVECEFRPVDPKWVKHLMTWAIWFHGRSEFPVLQAIYPDLENRFPGEEGFNAYFAQPLLQPDAVQTRIEEDFWASNDPESSLFDWKFPDPPHTLVYLSNTVNEGTEEITYVSHDSDGDWQFLGDSMSAGGGPVIVCFHHPIDKEPGLKELADLPRGWCADRVKPGEPWVRRVHGPEDEE